jgi:hypothetical protein
MTDYPFEIHVTVDPHSDLEVFKSVSNSLGVKPLELINISGRLKMLDLMTSSKMTCDYNQVVARMKEIADTLAAAGLRVVREKIETVPWYESAPSAENGLMMFSGQYFETHINVLADEADFEVIKEIAKRNYAHLSQNLNKQYDNGKFVIMVTQRATTGTYEDFLDECADLIADLGSRFEVGKPDTEFAVFDSNIAHDGLWLMSV